MFILQLIKRELKTLKFEKAFFYLYIYENKITRPLLKKVFLPHCMSIKQLDYELDSMCDYGRLELDRWAANN